MTYAPPAGQPGPYPTQPAVPSANAKNTIGLIALIVAIVAFVLAVIPPTSFIAWLPAIAAIVLAIIGLTRKGQKKGTSIAAIVIAPVAWIIAVIVALATTLFAVGDAIDDAGSAPSAGTSIEGSSEEPSEGSDGEESTPDEAAIGDAVVNDDGVSFTITGMTCGLASAGEAPFDADASGEFCEVKLSVSNGSSDPISISGADVVGYIGDASYEADTLTSAFGDDIYFAEVNPGLSIDGVLYFDVPTGQQLELVELSTLFGFDSVTVRVS